MMKSYLIISLLCLGSRLFAPTDPGRVPGYTVENIRFKSAGIILTGTIFRPAHPQASLVLVLALARKKE